MIYMAEEEDDAFKGDPRFQTWGPGDSKGKEGHVRFCFCLISPKKLIVFSKLFGFSSLIDG